jgi:hypothetical protein
MQFIVWPKSLRLAPRPLAATLAVLLAGAALAAPARAILLTPRTEPGRFTLGAEEMWYHRDTEWDDGFGESNDSYNLGTIWAKYGFHRRVTGFFEFALLNGDPHHQGVSYRYFNLGIGANVLLVEFEDFYVSGLVNYFENFQHDNRETACHSTTRHWAALLQFGKVFPLGEEHKLDAWWGPSYIRDEQDFDGGACAPGRKESVNNWGFAGGGDFLFWDHLEVFGHVIFARYFQPRLGVGYRF